MVDQTRQPESEATALYKGAVLLTVVSGLFCVVIASMLIVSHVRYGHADPMDSPLFKQLNEQLRANPSDQALNERAMTTDLQLRNRYFKQRQLNKTGGYLLLSGMLVFVLGAKLTSTLRRRFPLPTATLPNAQQKRQMTWLSCVAVGGVAVVLGSIAGGLMVGQVIELKAVASDEKITVPEVVKIEEVFDYKEYVKHWPRFRGPGGLGIAKGDGYPLEFDGETGQNILWKSPVELQGFNSPIVWGDKVFLCGSRIDRHDKVTNKVYCFDSDTGKQLWQQAIKSPGSPRELEIYEDTGLAAATMATDGYRVYAIFGTGELGAVDFNGKVIWTRTLTVEENAYGMANSLTTYGDKLIVQLDRGYDDDNLSVLIAIDGATGKDVWRVKRPVGGSWCSPIVVRDEKLGDRIITVAMPWVIAHDALTGKIIWQLEGIGEDCAPSPIVDDQFIYAVSVSDQMFAIKPDGQGDVTKTHVAWKFDEGDLPDISSPISDGERIYLACTFGVLTVVNIADGKMLYDHDFNVAFNASPTLVGDKIYLFNTERINEDDSVDEGLVFVIKASDKFELVSQCKLGEMIFASPAFVNGRIYIRGAKHLYCVEEDKKGDGNKDSEIEVKTSVPTDDKTSDSKAEGAGHE